MADLTSAQWAPVLDQTDTALAPGNATLVSSDPTVASIGVGTDGIHAVIGHATGTATLTATRLSDGAVATLDVSVEGVSNEFTIHLGTPRPLG